MGFSNIGKHKYSWVLNIIRYVYLKVGRWYLNKIMCDKKKKYPNKFRNIDVYIRNFTFV